jgi:hypothetical protein
MGQRDRKENKRTADMSNEIALIEDFHKGMMKEGIPICIALLGLAAIAPNERAREFFEAVAVFIAVAILYSTCKARKMGETLIEHHRPSGSPK